MRKLCLTNFQSPGDIVMLTAAVRDLHLSNPNGFLTTVKTSAMELWRNNPYLTHFDSGDREVEFVECEYPLIEQANVLPYHMIHGFRLHLQERLSVKIDPHDFRGDIHLSANERRWISPVEEEVGIGARYWVIVGGGKRDFTAKLWDPNYYQEVVDHFKGRILFAQCGSTNHEHPKLKGVVNLLGRTSLRQFVNVIYHADGVLCPVTLAMHLAAAVETKPGRPRSRACVVVAGGREPAHWEAYAHHQFLHTLGGLSCCDSGGCWKSRVVPLSDGDVNDQSICEMPVTTKNGVTIPKCLNMIKVSDVIRAIEKYEQC